MHISRFMSEHRFCLHCIAHMAEVPEEGAFRVSGTVKSAAFSTQFEENRRHNSYILISVNLAFSIATRC
jgi:hypothetical protein